MGPTDIYSTGLIVLAFVSLRVPCSHAVGIAYRA
jgi:hypothetical protein